RRRRRLPHAREDLDGIAFIEVEPNEELQGLSHLWLRKSQPDLGSPVGDRLQAEKAPLALISQRETKTPKLHHELVPLGADRDGAIRGMLVAPDDVFDREVERD